MWKSGLSVQQLWRIRQWLMRALGSRREISLLGLPCMRWTWMEAGWTRWLEGSTSLFMLAKRAAIDSMRLAIILYYDFTYLPVNHIHRRNHKVYLWILLKTFLKSLHSRRKAPLSRFSNSLLSTLAWNEETVGTNSAMKTSRWDLRTVSTQNIFFSPLTIRVSSVSFVSTKLGPLMRRSSSLWGTSGSIILNY